MSSLVPGNRVTAELPKVSQVAADGVRIQTRPLSHQCLPVLEAAELRAPTDVLAYLFFLSHTAASSQWNQPIPGPLLMRCAHGRCPTAVCWPRAGIQKGEEGAASSIKTGANSPPPSTAQLPGYCPRLGRHLLWVISICMAIITAFGKKIPLSQSPAELLMPAQNWRRQLRQTPARLLPITDTAGAACPHRSTRDQREYGRPRWQPGAAWDGSWRVVEKGY